MCEGAKYKLRACSRRWGCNYQPGLRKKNSQWATRASYFDRPDFPVQVSWARTCVCVCVCVCSHELGIIRKVSSLDWQHGSSFYSLPYKHPHLITERLTAAPCTRMHTPTHTDTFTVSLLVDCTVEKDCVVPLHVTEQPRRSFDSGILKQNRWEIVTFLRDEKAVISKLTSTLLFWFSIFPESLLLWGAWIYFITIKTCTDRQMSHLLLISHFAMFWLCETMI